LAVFHVATRYRHGGSETRIRDFFWSFPEADHHLIIGPDSDVELARRHLEPASLTVLDSLVREPSPRRDLAALRTLRRTFLSARPDLIVTHQSKAGVLGRLAARRVHGAHTIHSLSMASFGPGYPRWQDLLFRMIESRLVRTTDAYAAVGEDLARRYASLGVPADRMQVIRSGIRLPSPGDGEARARRAIRDRFGIPIDRPLILYLGSLESRKNVFELVPMMSRILALEPERKPFLVVAGEGPLFQQLSSRLEAAGLTSDAALLGFVHEPGLLLGAADVLVLLSLTEGVPQVLVQASAAGTPFVAYAVDGVEELLRLGASGIAVSPGDLDAVARETSKWLRLGRGGARSTLDLSHWSTEFVRSGYRSLVSTVLESNGNGHRAKRPKAARPVG
jgi:glycosyltransferase involved in cell wall biosynthesis